MIIKTITIKNWTSHGYTKLNFSKGVNAFVGVIGSGKTSVLEAISFALFGKFPEGGRKRKKNEQVISYNENEAEVTLTFEIDGNEYKIIRKLRKNASGEALLLLNNEVIERQPKNVNEAIEKLIEINYEVFSRVIFSPQEELNRLLSTTPSERKELFDKLMGINKLKEVGDKSKRMLRTVKNYLGSTERVDEKELEKEEQQWRIEKERVEMQKKKLEQLKQEVGLLHNQLLALEKKLNELKRKKKTQEDLNIKKAKLEQRIETFKDVKKIDKEEINQYTKIINEKRYLLESLKKELNNIELLYKQALAKKAKKDQLERELAHYKQHLLSAKNELSNFDENKLKVLEKNMLELTSNIGRINASIEAEKKSLQELKKAGDKCPVCKSPLTYEKKQTLENQALTNIKRYNDMLSNLYKQKELLSKELEKERRKKERYERMKGKIKEMQSSIEQKTKELNEIKVMNIEEIEKRKAEMQKKIEEQWNAIKDLESIIKEKEDMRRKWLDKQQAIISLNEVINKLNNLQFSNEELNATEEKYKDILALYKKKETELDGLKKYIAHTEPMLKKMFEFIENKKAIVKKIKKLNKLKHEFELFNEVIEDLQYYVRKEVIKELNLILPNIWKKIYPYSDYDNVKIDVDEKGYYFKVFTSPLWMDISQVASGGERTTFSIALKMALADLLIERFKIIIFDEPTGNLDDNTVDQLINALETSFSETVDQIFIITHDERLKYADIGRIYEFSREKTKNDKTKVSIIK